MKKELNVAFTLQLLMHLLLLGNKFEQRSDNSSMDSTFISCLVFAFANPNVQYLPETGLWVNAICHSLL